MVKKGEKEESEEREKEESEERERTLSSHTSFPSLSYPTFKPVIKVKRDIEEREKEEE